MRSGSNGHIERVSSSVGQPRVGYLHLLSLKLGFQQSWIVLGLLSSATNQVRILRLLLIVNDHRLDIREHVGSLPETLVLFLGLLNGTHAFILVSDQVTFPQVFLVVVFA